MKIAIGICAKNEQNTIIQTLETVVVAIKSTSDYKEYPIILCLNGNTDQTRMLIQEWVQKNKAIDFSIIILEKANLVEAQRAIVDASTSMGCTHQMFFDADVLVDVDCVSALAKGIQKDNVKVAYAVSLPIIRPKLSLIEMALNQYDVSPTIYTPRKHLHGRAFIITGWDIPKTDPALTIDDIFLSYNLLSKFGEASILMVDSARVYFYQVNTIGDLKNAMVRRDLEIKKCLALFPHFKKIKNDGHNRLIIWHKLFNESPKRILLWGYLILVKKIIVWKHRIKTIFNTKYNYEQWAPTMSSKRKRDTPLIVLIEGLDCSGKKTVAKLISRCLYERGVSNIIHIGPFGSVGYNYLSRIVSMNRVPNFLRTIVYSFEGFGDRSGYKRLNADVIIQVSSPFRSWAYAKIKKQNLRMTIIKLISRFYINYDQVYLLTCPYSVRAVRHLSQSAKNMNSDDVKRRFNDESAFEMMDLELEKMICKTKGFEKFDTNTTNNNFIVCCIMDKIMSILN
jgi:glycosyltransferase involved in cell wall biosynthesis